MIKVYDENGELLGMMKPQSVKQIAVEPPLKVKFQKAKAKVAKKYKSLGTYITKGDSTNSTRAAGRLVAAIDELTALRKEKVANGYKFERW